MVGAMQEELLVFMMGSTNMLSAPHVNNRSQMRDQKIVSLSLLLFAQAMRRSTPPRPWAANSIASFTLVVILLGMPTRLPRTSPGFDRLEVPPLNWRFVQVRWSSFRTVVPTKEGTFVLLSGEPKIYMKVFESGNRREQAFCADCGTPIYSAPLATSPKSLF
jgi:hypothetical protein